MELVGLPSLPERTLQDYAQLFFARYQACQAWNKMWQTEKLDALLTFVAPHTAVPVDTWTARNLAGLFNLVDYPALVIPVGKVQESDLKDQAAGYGTADEAVYNLCGLLSPAGTHFPSELTVI
jgi:amidase